MSSVLKDTLRDLPWTAIISDCRDTKDIILWRIALNLAEIADQLAEMNGYKVENGDAE